MLKLGWLARTALATHMLIGVQRSNLQRVGGTPSHNMLTHMVVGGALQPHMLTHMEVGCTPTLGFNPEGRRGFQDRYC